ncbi:helix-turn-helix domain-containing protein [Bradyrhizobium sp. dw_78]|uniref:helix-turn-helix domain-containing protein n=1 Tax=Bradyrhizobium sp. dw_78 TaxID=2719793 RepID=UPI001BD58255|nr:helix-turn-helix domain-containing protein [Bradyrhizobium sp. dw_78]
MLNYAAATGPARFAAPPYVLFNIDEPRGPTGTVMRFARNSEIYGEDEAAEYFYQVISGAVRAYKILDDGRRQISAFYLPGDIFGLEAGDEYTSSADAIADSHVNAIKRSTVLAQADQDRSVVRQLWSLTSQELARVQNRALLLIKTAEERVAGFLLEMARRAATATTVQLPMCRRDIADYLGLTIETVSRTLTQFEHAGLIALPASRRVELRDRAALNRMNS